MKYPKRIDLVKLETLPNAKYPQENKYPSGNIVARGFLFELNYPKVGERFVIMDYRLYPLLQTSIIHSIDKETKDEIEFITLNSKYRIVIKKPVEHEFKEMTREEVEQNRSKAYKYEEL